MLVGVKGFFAILGLTTQPSQILSFHTHCETNLLAKRVFKRCRLAGQKLCSVLRDHHYVFTPHAALSANINSRLVAEAHRCFELRLVPSNQISPLVAVHPNAVTDAVCEVFVIRTISGIGDDFSSSGVDVFAGDPGPRCLQRRSLSALDDVEDLELLIGWFAKHRRSSNVRSVAFNAASAVDQNDVAFAKLLRSYGAMRQSRIRGKQNQRAAASTHLLMRCRDLAAQLVVSHPFFQ